MRPITFRGPDVYAYIQWLKSVFYTDPNTSPLVNVEAVYAAIKAQLPLPPTAPESGSFTELASAIFEFGALAPGADVVFGILGAASNLAGDLTQTSEGSPEIDAPFLDLTADQLAAQLAQNYSDMSNQLDRLSRSQDAALLVTGAPFARFRKTDLRPSEPLGDASACSARHRPGRPRSSGEPRVCHETGARALRLRQHGHPTILCWRERRQAPSRDRTSDLRGAAAARDRRPAGAPGQRQGGSGPVFKEPSMGYWGPARMPTSPPWFAACRHRSNSLRRRGGVKSRWRSPPRWARFASRAAGRWAVSPRSARAWAP
jgi:hypothetical protein